MIFALFFGAGNLIFPLHLGQIAGHNWFLAALGFLITVVLLPLLSILAIALIHANGVYEIGLPFGSTFALIFMTLIHLTIGPLFGTPRTATVSYTVGIAPFILSNYQKLGLLIFSALFFIFTYFISYNQSNILDNLGKILNSIFLVLLFLVFIVVFLFPIENPNTVKSTTDYLTSSGAVMNGFLQGYNTIGCSSRVSVRCNDYHGHSSNG